MNRQHIHIDLIEKYLNNEKLTDIEVELFNKTLENDEGFVRELNDIELLIAGIKKTAARTSIEEKIERFESSIKNMDKDEKPDSKKHIIKYIIKHPWMIAASLTFLFVTSAVLFSINQTPSYQKLYTEYYSPFENYPTKRGSEKEEQNLWKKALTYYDMGMYQDALDNFDKIQTSEYSATYKNPSFQLYKGNALMKLNKHDEAKVIFQGMVDNEEGMIIQAKWYLSMCYLYEDNEEKLIPLLEEIAEVKASSYSRKSSNILNQLH